MRRTKVITSNAELEEFLARTDIEVINVDVRSCEQSWFAQEFFTAAIYYDDEPKYEYSPDYWEKLKHQYAGMAMNALLLTNNIRNGDLEGMRECNTNAMAIAHALVEKYKKKEK